jgi:phenylacetate-coenzyme A ligase PaaK-like adenylate-forming protein
MIKWSKLSRLGRKRIEKLQNKKLRAFIRYQIWPYHPYYRRLFKRNNLNPYSISTTADLAKIPFTTKDDIAPTEKEPQKPLDFIIRPNKKLIKRYSPKLKLIRILFNKQLVYDEYKPLHIHLTAGRTSLPVPFLYTNYDLEKLKEAGRRLMDVCNAPKDSIVINGFPYAPHLAFWQTYYAMIANNLLSLQTGGGKIMGTARIITAIEKMKASVLSFTPGYAYHLIRKAAKEKRNFSSVKYVLFGGERIPTGLKEKIEELLTSMKSKNPKILGTYAFTEGKVAWTECDSGYGYHLYPDFELIETVNEKGESVEGEKGEIVYTALDFRGTVVLRYKTGDISKIHYEKCPNCGRTTPRIDENIERKSEYRALRYTKVKGTLVNLNRFYSLLMGNKDIEEWQIEIKKKNNDPYEVDELVIYVAPRNKAKTKLKSRLREEILSETEITPTIVIKDLDELLGMLGMETELKEKRIVDRR